MRLRVRGRVEELLRVWNLEDLTPCEPAPVDADRVEEAGVTEFRIRERGRWLVEAPGAGFAVVGPGIEPEVAPSREAALLDAMDRVRTYGALLGRLVAEPVRVGPPCDQIEPRARVHVMAAGHVPTTMDLPDGRHLRLDAPLFADWIAAPLAPGEKRVVIADPRGASITKWARVGAGETASLGTLPLLVSRAELHVRIEDDGGRPVERPIVHFHGFDPAYADGRFALALDSWEWAGPGEIRLRAVPPDSAQIRIAVATPGFVGGEAVVRPGDAPRIRLRRRDASGSVAGRVEDESGRPVAGASVLVRETRVGVVTDADGSFRIGAVDGTRTTLHLEVRCRGFRRAKVEAENRMEDLRIRLERES
jgi:hypothetical protein